MQVYGNVTAFSVWKSYAENVSAMRNSMGKLSSGLRMVHAGDDPAGLAMSERLRAQYRNTAQAAANVEGKLNYLQTADAWLQKIHDLTGRMSELAIMANDGTKSQIDRDNLQREFSHMQQEIRRITSGATAAGKYNGMYLFRGGNGVPILNEDMVEGNTRGFFTVRRVSGGTALSDDYAAQYDQIARQWTVFNLTTDSVIGQISAGPREGGEVFFTEGGSQYVFTIEPPHVGGYQDGARIEFNRDSIGVARTENMGFSSVPARGSATLSVSGSGAGITDADWSLTYDGSAWTLRNETTGTDVQTVAVPANGAAAMPFIEGANGFSIQIHSPGGATCYSEGDRFVWSNRGGQVGTPEFRDAPATNGEASVALLGDGLGVSTADYRATYNGHMEEWVIVNETTGDTVATLAASPFEGAETTLEGPNGFRITFAPPSSGGYSHGDVFTWSNVGPTGEYQTDVRVTLQVGPDSNMIFREEEINLESANFGSIGSYATYSYGSVNLTLLGSLHQTVRWGSLISGQHLSISRQEMAGSAVAMLHVGVDYISSIRSVVGAEMKRMEHTLSGLRSYEHNARATESRIRDVDVARETVEYSRMQILLQISQAMLAQANALPAGVLQLLG